MPIKKEQEFHKDSKIKHRRNWLRKFLLAGCSVIVLLVVMVSAFILFILSAPANLTFIARYWLPLTVIEGMEKDKPAGRLTFDKLVMKWPVLKKGFNTPVTFELEGLKLLDVYNQVRDHLDFAKLTLDTSSLRHKKIVPLYIKLSGAQLHLRRYKDNHVNLDLSGLGLSRQSRLDIDFHRLYHVKIEKTVLSFKDDIDHNLIQSRQIDVDVHPFYADKTLTIIGKVYFNFDINGHKVQIKGQSSVQSITSSDIVNLQKTGKLQWHMEIYQVNPANIAEMIPELRYLQSVNMPISAEANIGFSIQNKAFMQPYMADIKINSAQGNVRVGNMEYFPSSFNARISAFFGEDAKYPAKIDFSDICLQLRSPSNLENAKSGPFFHFKGWLKLSSLLNPKVVDADFSAGSPLLDFSTLKEYWPRHIAKGANKWVTGNITRGQARDFSIHARLMGHEGWHHLRLVHLEGGIAQATDLEVHWLRPIPPLQKMNAQMLFVDPDRILIKYRGGYQIVRSGNGTTSKLRKLNIPSGNMWITGLSNHRDLGIITLLIKGKLQDLLTLLSEQRLHLLSRHPVPFKNPSGDLSTHLHLEIPLKKKVKIEQIDIQGHNEIKNVYLKDIALGQDLRQGNLVVDVNARQLDLHGYGLLSYFPARIEYRQNFTHQYLGSLVEKAKVGLTITSETLKQTGFDMAKDIGGQAYLDLNYSKFYDKKAIINLNLDLSRTELKLPIWHKLIAKPAKASGTIILNDNKLVGIQDLHAQGSDLLVHANMNIENRIPTQLNIQYFKTGRSEGKATINFPMTDEAFHNPLKGDVRISVKADTLDLSPFIQDYLGSSRKKHAVSKKSQNYNIPVAATGKYKGLKGRRWIFNLQAKKIFYDKNKNLGEVTAYIEYNGLRLMRLSYGMRQPTLVTASLFPKDSNRQFYLDAQNLGNLLDIVGISNRISGGHCVLSGNFDDNDPEAPFTGKIQIEPFVVDHVPTALKRISNLSVYGWFKRQKADALNIDALKGNIFLNKGILKIKNGRVFNDELGATLKGDINLDKAVLDLQGTIVPIYAVNKLFSHVPGVGKLFVPEKGGGFIAVPFVINGKFKDPHMEAYPSMLLTPGFLRNLF